MSNKSKVVLITRIKLINKRKDIDDFRKWYDVFLKNKNITNIYILSDQLSKDNLKLNDKKAEFIILPDPISPISMNLAIEKIAQETDYFIVTSKEVQIKEKHINNFLSWFKDNENLLVVGYKLKIKDNNKLDKELQNYYKDKSFIAYIVPWNTCAIWNYQLFCELVSKFDKITDKNYFSPVCVCIDNVCSKTPHKGMEDGLAIAQATSNKKRKIYFKLINKPLFWKIDDEQRHREKLARKDTVMRNFMAVRNYSVKDLLDSEMK